MVPVLKNIEERLVAQNYHLLVSFLLPVKSLSNFINSRPVDHLKNLLLPDKWT